MCAIGSQFMSYFSTNISKIWARSGWWLWPGYLLNPCSRALQVWYHTCPNRGKGCSDTRLRDQGGCAIWYDEKEVNINTVFSHISPWFYTISAWRVTPLTSSLLQDDVVHLSMISKTERLLGGQLHVTSIEKFAEHRVSNLSNYEASG